MAAWEALGYKLHTRTALFEAPSGTLVLACAERLTAWLIAIVFFVFRVCWMANHFTHMTALKSCGTRHRAASLGRLLEVIRT